MIEVRNLRKTFGQVVAVDDVSFRAGDGRVTGLLGPNGAGKTTTLRVLYTILKPDSGEASVDGFNTVHQPLQAQSRMGVLPENHGLYPRLSARENIAYFGRLQGMADKQLKQRISDLSAMLEMQDFIDRKTEGFSSGQRMKVAIARALIHDPANVLLDEPTNGLDVMSTRAMRGLIRRLRDEGKCVVFSSHIMQEVSMLCDEIVVIDRGRVVVSGNAEELKRQTGQQNLEDAFVAAIGSEEGLQR